MYELTRSSDLDIVSVSWVWDRRVPSGNLTILVGEEGLGKTACLCWLAARLSRGELPGDWEGRAGKTLFLSAEDGYEDTLNGRLEAAGADRRFVSFLQAASSDGKHQQVVLPEDSAQLADTIEREGVDLLIIDPLNAYLGKTDSHKDTGIRGALGPIIARAGHGRKFAIVGVLHVNKGKDKNERQAMMGSAGYRNAARSTLIFGLDPDEPDKDGPLRVLVHGDKHNLARRQCGYKMRMEEINWGDIQTIRLVQGEETWTSSEAVLSATTGEAPESASTIDAAVTLITKMVADGPCAAKDIVAAAEQAGISKKTLERASRKANVYKAPTAFGGEWAWDIPPQWMADLLKAQATK